MGWEQAPWHEEEQTPEGFAAELARERRFCSCDAIDHFVELRVEQRQKDACDGVKK